ncbi:MAG TPA: L,D-transpeptidase [Ktedonobacterales bacterium]
MIRHGWRLRVALTAVMGLGVLSLALTACGPSQAQTQAEQNKSRLDHELTRAKTELGLPDSLLQPIETQEAKVAAGEGGWNYNYQDAAANYALLTTQLQGVEQTAGQTLKQQASDDIQAFTTAVTNSRAAGFDQSIMEVYQNRLTQAVTDFDAARLPADYGRVDTFARQQTEALNAMGPAYDKLQEFNKIILAITNAGYTSPLAQSLYQSDVAAFTAALSAAKYNALVGAIDGQITQLEADQTESLPYIGSTLLDQFAAKITLLKSYGENASSYQTQYNQDAARFKSASSLADYLALSQAINRQTESMTLPLIRGAARQTLKQLASFISYVNAHDQTLDPANGVYYPDAYEYSSPFWGLSDAQQVFASAQSLSDYQHAYNYAFILLTNLRALQDDLSDHTPHYLPHASDLTLLSTYHITGKVVVVSLREQTARFYENGKLIYWSYVTTGNLTTPSVPGLNYAMYKLQHTTFISPDPPGSPEWYAPTPINFAIAYSPGGYFLHDAWWRAEFGPYTNLPHWDPAAFNGGSHGCVNFPLSNMGHVYSIVDINEPIILY